MHVHEQYFPNEYMSYIQYTCMPLSLLLACVIGPFLFQALIENGPSILKAFLRDGTKSTPDGTHLLFPLENLS